MIAINFRGHLSLEVRYPNICGTFITLTLINASSTFLVIIVTTIIIVIVIVIVILIVARPMVWSLLMFALLASCLIYS